jgi:hypothetical protein
MKFTGRMKAPHYAGFIAENRLETTPPFATIDVSVGRRVAFGPRALVITVSGRNLTDAYQRDLDRGPPAGRQLRLRPPVPAVGGRARASGVLIVRIVLGAIVASGLFARDGRLVARGLRAREVEEALGLRRSSSSGSQTPSPVRAVSR